MRQKKRVSQDDRVERRLRGERGRLERRARFTIGHAYPSPYHVGMSSLGYQQIYRIIQTEGDSIACERLFRADDDDPEGPCLSYESRTPLGSFPVVTFSVAYELELAGLIEMLSRSKVAPLASERTPRDPFILAGGPLTFSNPVPLGPYVDAVILGEADSIVLDVLARLRDLPRSEVLSALAAMPSVWVPSIHGEDLPELGKADHQLLPAHAAIMTPDTELSDMFLVEAERGCSRGCQYCVMRRSTNGGMRIVPIEKIHGLIPSDARKVGLVGAAVSDHPHVTKLVQQLADEGKQVGLSSLRPDRLTDPFVAALKAGGYRTLTTAMDGPSERLRALIERKTTQPQLTRVAELARAHGLSRLKLYLMVGLPTETNEDLDECADFVRTLSKVIPVSLGIAPFCAKRNTPLDGPPFAGVAEVSAKLALLRERLAGRAEVRATSARWAWVEYYLAQGGFAQGLAVLDAVRAGGKFADYKRAFEKSGPVGLAPKKASPPGDVMVLGRRSP